MTKEEQRFTAAVAAMQGMLSNPEIMRAKLDFFKYQTVDSCIKMSIQYADALIKELYVVKIKRLCEDDTHDCPNCNFDDINSIEDCCPKCGSKIDWV